MRKGLNVFSSVFIFLFFLSGCQSSKKLEASTYDEKYDTEQRERFSDLKEALFNKYGEDSEEMKKMSCTTSTRNFMCNTD